MDSFEFNKILGALLATVFIVFSVGIISDTIFAAPVPEKPGYHIEAVEEEAGGGGAPAGPESVIPLLASANIDAGMGIFKKCTACHTAEKGGANKAGPNLFDIVNRPVASHEGFGYSSGMKAFAEGGKVWDYEHLDHFLYAPKGYVKGTAMGFGGVKKTQERADLIAYLHTLSDSPAPLPEAGAAAPAADGAAPAAEGATAEGTTPPAEGAAAPAEEAPKPAPAQ